MSTLFERIVNSYVVLVSDGVYRQAEIYTHKGRVYAKLGSGFIGLRVGGTTTKAKVTYTEFVGKELSTRSDTLGRLYVLTNTLNEGNHDGTRPPYQGSGTHAPVAALSNYRG